MTSSNIFPTRKGSLDGFLEFLEKLEEKKIYYRLNKIRDQSIMVEVDVPGEKWEIEFNTYGEDSSCVVGIEKFISTGEIWDESELDVLFREYSD